MEEEALTTAPRCFREGAAVEEEALTTAPRCFREGAAVEEEAAAVEAMAQDAMARVAPSWIRIVHSDELPLHEVFTACRAVIHHAGAGRL